MSQQDAGFAGRLAYLRWLRARGRAAPETDREVAAAAGVGYPWFTKWKSRADAPDSHVIRERFLRGLHLDSTWIFDGQGEPPEPDLWRRWLERPSYLRVMAETPPTYDGGHGRHAKASKKRRRQ